MRQAKRDTRAKQSGKTLKERRTFTLSRESLELLKDLCEARRGARRRSVSRVLDDLLRALQKQKKREAVDQAVTNFYDGLSGPAQSEEKEWGEFSLAQFMDGAD
jgi:replicative DNA helicase